MDQLDYLQLQQKVASVKSDYAACMNQLELLHQAIQDSYSNPNVMRQLELLNNQMQQLGQDINAPWW